MKLSQINMVNRHVEARQALLHRIAIVETPLPDNAWPHDVENRKFRIVIDGFVQDEAIHALVRPVLLGELRAQVRRIDADLSSLGVHVD